ncbi:dehydroquinate synthase/iron-containing alcohol dehydrogenase family protein [Roseobacter sinensis]|uniref:Iron-containing alcohol dehydrogenase n=1 Tax=Roseobacter sinensis TaxID=2931391 RepID=A0ABT3BJ96_9RHOB|nr:iron-containing alcohol dehydrogenase [Roseobacter sp. WL0113]MCV3273429.1 iron-containing alcohol dehydrogenase [Roseobacter sp. WL0113]
MTLIHLQSRIHFADGVLEEALRGEVEAAAHKTLCVLYDERDPLGDVALRIGASLPNRTATQFIGATPDDTKQSFWERLQTSVDPAECDALIAFGTARVIAFGRKCRVEIANARYAKASAEQRLKRRRSLLPDYVVIPGIDGLPDPCSDPGGASLFRGVPPSVVICDPTLTVGTDAETRASCYATTLTRCIQSLGVNAFNPVADAFATEGLRRLVLAGVRTEDTPRLEQYRDLMAAALSGAMSQQKGVAILQLVSGMLQAMVDRSVQPGVLNRILLPHFADRSLSASDDRNALVRYILKFPVDVEFDICLAEFLDPLPLQKRLRDLGLTRRAVRKTSLAVSSDARAATMSADEIEAALNAAY